MFFNSNNQSRQNRQQLADQRRREYERIEREDIFGDIIDQMGIDL